MEEEWTLAHYFAHVVPTAIISPWRFSNIYPSALLLISSDTAVLILTMTFKSRIAQLAKAPITGQVKTRLMTRLGPQGACDLHKKMVEHLNQKLRCLDGFQYELWISEPHPFFETLCSDPMSLHQQIGKNLGERMSHIVANALGDQFTILIGSDCPELGQQHMQQMVQELAWADLAVIPALDGGYVALAQKCHYPQLFEGIQWGGDQVLRKTLECAEQIGLAVSVLEPMQDIDRPEDLQGLSGFP
jgi:rSAM/selenodomain-associated transferase 1